MTAARVAIHPVCDGVAVVREIAGGSETRIAGTMYHPRIPGITAEASLKKALLIEKLIDLLTADAGWHCGHGESRGGGGDSPIGFRDAGSADDQIVIIVCVHFPAQKQ